ncbi:MAG: hypothetical protein NTY47_05835, partial [Candidatus Omnitrophica bacterium]|nr:hypothetical protein [Candidatus Omnitrophota bacterium]
MYHYIGLEQAADILIDALREESYIVFDCVAEGLVNMAELARHHKKSRAALISKVCSQIQCPTRIKMIQEPLLPYRHQVPLQNRLNNISFVALRVLSVLEDPAAFPIAERLMHCNAIALHGSVARLLGEMGGEEAVRILSSANTSCSGDDILHVVIGEALAKAKRGKSTRGGRVAMTATMMIISLILLPVVLAFAQPEAAGDSPIEQIKTCFAQPVFYVMVIILPIMARLYVWLFPRKIGLTDRNISNSSIYRPLICWVVAASLLGASIKMPVILILAILTLFLAFAVLVLVAMPDLEHLKEEPQQKPDRILQAYIFGLCKALGINRGQRQLKPDRMAQMQWIIIREAIKNGSLAAMARKNRELSNQGLMPGSCWQMKVITQSQSDKNWPSEKTPVFCEVRRSDEGTSILIRILKAKEYGWQDCVAPGEIAESERYEKIIIYGLDPQAGVTVPELQVKGVSFKEFLKLRIPEDDNAEKIREEIEKPNFFFLEWNIVGVFHPKGLVFENQWTNDPRCTELVFDDNKEKFEKIQLFASHFDQKQLMKWGVVSGAHYIISHTHPNNSVFQLGDLGPWKMGKPVIGRRQMRMVVNADDENSARLIITLRRNSYNKAARLGQELKARVADFRKGHLSASQESIWKHCIAGPVERYFRIFDDINSVPNNIITIASEPKPFPAQAEEISVWDPVELTAQIKLTEAGLAVSLDQNNGLTPIERREFSEAIEFALNEHLKKDRTDKALAWIRSHGMLNVIIHGEEGPETKVEQGKLYISWRAIRAPPQLNLEGSQKYLYTIDLSLSLRVNLYHEFRHLIYSDEKELVVDWHTFENILLQHPAILNAHKNILNPEVRNGIRALGHWQGMFEVENSDTIFPGVSLVVRFITFIRPLWILILLPWLVGVKGLIAAIPFGVLAVLCALLILGAVYYQGFTQTADLRHAFSPWRENANHFAKVVSNNAPALKEAGHTLWPTPLIVPQDPHHRKISTEEFLELALYHPYNRYIIVPEYQHMAAAHLLARLNIIKHSKGPYADQKATGMTNDIIKKAIGLLALRGDQKLLDKVIVKAKEIDSEFEFKGLPEALGMGLGLEDLDWVTFLDDYGWWRLGGESILDEMSGLVGHEPNYFYTHTSIFAGPCNIDFSKIISPRLDFGIGWFMEQGMDKDQAIAYGCYLAAQRFSQDLSSRIGGEGVPLLGADEGEGGECHVGFSHSLKALGYIDPSIAEVFLAALKRAGMYDDYARIAFEPMLYKLINHYNTVLYN